MEDIELEIDSESDGVFQKPNKYLNVLTPGQRQHVDEDADLFLARVKTQLTQAVRMQDIKRGARFWSLQLVA